MKIKWIFAKCGFLWHLKCEMTFKLSIKIKWIFAKCSFSYLSKYEINFRMMKRLTHLSYYANYYVYEFSYAYFIIAEILIYCLILYMWKTTTTPTISRLVVCKLITKFMKEQQALFHSLWKNLIKKFPQLF